MLETERIAVIDPSATTPGTTGIASSSAFSAFSSFFPPKPSLPAFAWQAAASSNEKIKHGGDRGARRMKGEETA